MKIENARSIFNSVNLIENIDQVECIKYEIQDLSPTFGWNIRRISYSLEIQNIAGQKTKRRSTLQEIEDLSELEFISHEQKTEDGKEYLYLRNAKKYNAEV